MGYSLLRVSLIGLFFPWIFFSFVSPLETKEKQSKPKETEGNQRKSKEVKGYQRKNDII